MPSKVRSKASKHAYVPAFSGSSPALVPKLRIYPSVGMEGNGLAGWLAKETSS